MTGDVVNPKFMAKKWSRVKYEAKKKKGQAIRDAIRTGGGSSHASGLNPEDECVLSTCQDKVRTEFGGDKLSSMGRNGNINEPSKYKI